MDAYLNLLSLLILVSSFALVANKRVKSYIDTFQLQSVLVALAAAVTGFESLRTEGAIDALLLCLVIVALKVVYIPRLLKRTIKQVEYKVEKDFYLNIPISVLICCGLVILTYYSLGSLQGIINSEIKNYLVNSISVVLIGLFFMMTRKKAIGQIVGFLVIENGLFTAAMLSAHGMPIIIDLGIFIDLLTAIMIMGMLVFRMNETFETINVNKLRNLRG